MDYFDTNNCKCKLYFTIHYYNMNMAYRLFDNSLVDPSADDVVYNHFHFEGVSHQISGHYRVFLSSRLVPFLIQLQEVPLPCWRSLSFPTINSVLGKCFIQSEVYLRGSDSGDSPDGVQPII